MLMYCPPAWSLENPGSETEVQLKVALAISDVQGPPPNRYISSTLTKEIVLDSTLNELSIDAFSTVQIGHTEIPLASLFLSTVCIKFPWRKFRWVWLHNDTF